MRKYLYIVIALTFAAVSCTKVIDLDLKESGAQIVLRADVTEGEMVHTLSITKSVGFDEDNVFPGVVGANVTLSDDQGNVTTLVDVGGGNYETTNYLAEAGRTYTYTVIAEGQTYESSCKIADIVPLTDVAFLPSNFFGDTGFIMVPKFVDPAGIKNSYLFYFYNANDPEENSDFIISNDDFADGQLNEQPFFGDYTPQAGDTVNYQMYGIDEAVYTYFFSFEQNTSGNSGAPANPVSNWSNNALGYFSAHNFQEIQVIAPL